MGWSFINFLKISLLLLLAFLIIVIFTV